MSQQALDLRRSMQIVRRHKLLVGIVVVLGIARWRCLRRAQAADAHEYRADRAPGSGERAAANSTAPPPPAEPIPLRQPKRLSRVVIQVLVDALPDVRPAMSLNELRHNVQVGSPSTDIISVTAKGKNAADAEATANAVANSYIRYVSFAHTARSGVYRRTARVG